MIRNPFRSLQPAEMLQIQLDRALRNRVEYVAMREEAEHSVHMLDARIARIRHELKAMNSNEEPRQ